MTALRQVWLVLRKDVLVELRTKETLLSMGLFALLTVVIFSFAFYTDEERSRVFAPGILWVTVVFSGTLGLNRLIAREQENGCMSGLLLSPMRPRTLFAGKVVGNLIFTLLMELLTVPLVIVFFGLRIDAFGLLAASLLLGTIGFCVVGTVFAAALAEARMKEVLLPLVVYPVVVPIIIGGVKSTGGVLRGEPIGEIVSWLQLMAGFDLLFLALSGFVFERLVSD